MSWDSHLESTVLELAARISEGKSISLKSVESYADDKALVIEKWSGNSVKHVLNGMKKNKLNPKASDKGKPDSELAIFLTNNNVVDNGGTTTYYDVLQSKSNYMAVNVNNHQDNQFGKEKPTLLQIRTNSMVLNEIIEKERNLTELANKWPSSSSSSPHQLVTLSSHDDNDYNGEREQMEVADKTGSLRPLLVLNGKQQSITLPSTSKLSLNSLTSGSIILNEKLRSPEVTGSLEENLE